MSVEKSKHEFFEASANSSPDPSVVGATLTGAPSLIVVMSLRLAIPWWVALQQGPPPLHQLIETLMNILAVLQRMISGTFLRESTNGCSGTFLDESTGMVSESFSRDVGDRL